LCAIAEQLGGHLEALLGKRLPISSRRYAADSNCIELQLDPKAVVEPEGYTLEVKRAGIRIIARTHAGLFWGVQTLQQLLSSVGEGVNVPGVTISDAPRFQYRGLHLDVARHMFSVDDIKKYIDLLASYKLNVFHWHLTDDQGWRIEILKYPRLQSVGAYRDETLIGPSLSEPKRYDGKRYGGYYTQQEVREIVEYARQRYVTIIPEIDLPGHSMAALAAYPELGCRAGGYKTACGWVVPDGVLCAGNDRVFEFLEQVLAEVIALFPGTFIHIGGDEVDKTAWQGCARCQDRMKREGLRDEHELQGYVMQRIAAYVASKGKRVIAWDEVIEQDLTEKITAMFWRTKIDPRHTIAKGHSVIMTPCTSCYFDFYQASREHEPLAIGFTPLEKVYAYEPVPASFTEREAQAVLGVQGNVWTEFMKSMAHVEYMAYPRALALAEIAWSDPKTKNYDDFLRRVKHHRVRLKDRGVNVAPHPIE